jgi:hypothetical protein
MIIKQRVVEKCKECGHIVREVSSEQFGCDCCKKPIDYYARGKHHHDYLKITIFKNDNPTEHLHLCSWKCVFQKLKKVRTDYFVTLPMLTYESDVVPGQRVQDFLKFVRTSNCK